MSRNVFAKSFWKNSRCKILMLQEWTFKCFYYNQSPSGGARGLPGVAVATTDLSLATPLATLLKTAVFVLFFLTKNYFIKTRNRCIFLHPHQTRLFRGSLQLCLSARRESNERGKDKPAKWASVEQRDAVRLYVSKTIFPVLSAVTVLTADALNASS